MLSLCYLTPLLFLLPLASCQESTGVSQDPSGTSPSSNNGGENPFAVIPAGYTSPDVPYPSLNRTSYHHSPRWEAAHAKARAFLEDWTNDEKQLLVTGTGWSIGRCVGNTPPIPSKNWAGQCLEDSPLGVRFADYVSAFPAGINVATTSVYSFCLARPELMRRFDKQLMYARGYAMGEEFKGKGVNTALGPMTNMGRVAAGGRNWEGFGGDPYLSGWATEMTIRGMQDAGVQATVKHYIANEEERNRTVSSSNVDDRTMREIYTHPFLKAVQADVASVMCSYNLINGSWACQNSKTLNGILKTDFGFQGYVMSDWSATHSGVLAANNGEDMDMPGDVYFGSLTSYFGENLSTGVSNGSIAQERLDDMAQRVMAGYFLLDQDKNYPEVNFDAFRPTAEVNNSHVDVQGEHFNLIREIGAASTVLLKNVNHTLPLKKPKSIGVFGSDMGPSMSGPNGFPDRGGDNGTLAMGWGSGTSQFPYLVDPLAAISHQAELDRSNLDWWLDDWDLSGVQTIALASEVCIVGINSDSGEQYITVDGNEGDRNNLTAWNNGDNVILEVAKYCSNVVVVVHSVGPLIVEPWIDHPNVTAVLWAGLPGQESGNSLVDVLYGWYNPSGRLPYTIAKQESDYSANITYFNSNIPPQPQVNYTEGLFIDYRHFLAQNITPRYEFGYGLSYSEFNFTNLEIWEVDYSKRELEDDQWLEEYYEDSAWDGSNVTIASAKNGTKVGSFLRSSLQKPRWTVTADIQNVGGVYGCEVPQLYLSYPTSAGEPPKVLRDFTRVTLAPWQAEKVYFNLSNYDVSIWDVVTQKWTIPEGEYSVTVGKSCLDQGVVGTFCPSGEGC